MNARGGIFRGLDSFRLGTLDLICDELSFSFGFYSFLFSVVDAVFLTRSFSLEDGDFGLFDSLVGLFGERHGIRV